MAIKRKKELEQMKCMLRGIWLAIVLIVAWLVHYYSPAQQYNRWFEPYLERKYGQDFVMGDSRKIWGVQIGDPQERSTDFYSKDNPAVVATIWGINKPNFDAIRDREGYANGTLYYDNYLEELWSRQYEEAIAPLMKECFGEDVLFEARLFLVANNMLPYYGRTPTIQEYFDNGDKIGFTLHAIIFTEQGKANHVGADEVKKTIRLQVRNYSYAYVDLGFYSQTDKEAVLQQLEEEGGGVLDYSADDGSALSGNKTLNRTVYRVSSIKIHKEDFAGVKTD